MGASGAHRKTVRIEELGGSSFQSEALECGSEPEQATALGEAKTIATKQTRNPELGTRKGWRLP
ncbi:MAG: hypothetical protein Kow00109_27160 [Acidobacteriota bacterium]